MCNRTLIADDIDYSHRLVHDLSEITPVYALRSVATSQLFDSSVLIAVDLKKAEGIEDAEFRKKTLTELKELDRRRTTLIRLCRQLYIDQKYVLSPY
jgi:hypothetical protein